MATQHEHPIPFSGTGVTVGLSQATILRCVQIQLFLVASLTLWLWGRGAFLKLCFISHVASVTKPSEKRQKIVLVNFMALYGFAKQKLLIIS